MIIRSSDPVAMGRILGLSRWVTFNMACRLAFVGPLQVLANLWRHFTWIFLGHSDGRTNKSEGFWRFVVVYPTRQNGYMEDRCLKNRRLATIPMSFEDARAKLQQTKIHFLIATCEETAWQEPCGCHGRTPWTTKQRGRESEVCETCGKHHEIETKKEEVYHCPAHAAYEAVWGMHMEHKVDKTNEEWNDDFDEKNDARRKRLSALTPEEFEKMASVILANDYKCKEALTGCPLLTKAQKNSLAAAIWSPLTAVCMVNWWKHDDDEEDVNEYWRELTLWQRIRLRSLAWLCGKGPFRLVLASLICGAWIWYLPDWRSVIVTIVSILFILVWKK